MKPEEVVVLIAQILGFVAMEFNIFSYQAKKGKGILVVQTVGATIWSTHFLMLGGLSGSLMNLISLPRNFIYANKEKSKLFSSKFIPFIFSFLYVVAGAIVLIIYKDLIDFLPVVAMCIQTFAYHSQNEKIIRLFSLISQPIWLIYNVFKLSIAGVVCEAFTIVSIIIALIINKKKKEETAQ